MKILNLPTSLYPFIFALLMFACWPPYQYLTFLVFIGLIPLFLLENKINSKGFKPLKTFGAGYVSFLIWNIATTWWVALADIGGGVAAMVLNSLLMTVPFYLFSLGKNKFNQQNWTYIFFPIFWLGFEQLHLSWELTWPWLTLGNVFAMHPWFIKMYSITGIWGGGLLIISVNILLFLSLIKNEQKFKYQSFIFILVFYLGGVLFQPHFDFKKQGNILMVQPNYDAYTEKFSIPSAEQQKMMMDLTDSSTDRETQMVLWPETSIVEEFDEKEPIKYPPIISNLFWMKNKNFGLIAGTNSQNNYGDVPNKPTVTARKRIAQNPDGSTHPFYFDLYNSATYFPIKSDKIEFYHKSRLVPGVERMPYPGFFAFLEPLTIKMGGTFGSVGTQDTPSVFRNGVIKTAPVICYESIFGDYVSKYVQQGANVIAIITNDDWWDESPGYKQHFHYGRLRAVEQGRYIYRAANTGVSGVIDPNGNILQELGYRKRGVIKSDLWISSQRTVYSYLSEYYRYFSYLLFILGFGYIVLIKRNKKLAHIK